MMVKCILMIRDNLARILNAMDWITDSFIKTNFLISIEYHLIPDVMNMEKHCFDSNLKLIILNSHF